MNPHSGELQISVLTWWSFTCALHLWQLSVKKKHRKKEFAFAAHPLLPGGRQCDNMRNAGCAALPG